MIGEVEAVLDNGIDIGRPTLTRALARVRQHVLDDRVGAPAVVCYLVQVTAQRLRKFADVLKHLVIGADPAQGLLQFVVSELQCRCWANSGSVERRKS